VIEQKTDARNEIRFLCIEELVPEEHLLRKVEKAVDFDEIYPMAEAYYCVDNGRSNAADIFTPGGGFGGTGENSAHTALVWVG